MIEPRSNDDIAPCVSAVMPVFNEVASVADMARGVLGQRPILKLIIVDDGSRDGTWEALQRLATDPRVRLIRHERNQGKGAALRTGLAHATAPILLVQDADAEYDPREYHLLLRPILAGKADAVIGSRFLGIGHFTAELARRPAIQELVAIEPEARFCQKLRGLSLRTTVVEGTIETLPADFTCDAVVSVNVLELLRLHYFNSVGCFAWYFHFRLLRQRSFAAASVTLFDRFIFPLVHALERRVLRPPFGQSLLCVARARP